MKVTTSRLQAGEAPDYSWLPELVEIGGFHYESGRRKFGGWAEAMTSLLGGSNEVLLSEIWSALPRATAEKLGSLINDSLSETERLQVAYAYRQLNFRPVDRPTAMLMKTLAALEEAFPSSEAPAVPAEDTSGHVHQHVCQNCGLPFTHEEWQCEPPDNRYCNLCAERAAGPRPIWIQRWTDDPQTDKDEPMKPSDTPSSRPEPGHHPATGVVIHPAQADPDIQVEAEPSKIEVTATPAAREAPCPPFNQAGSTSPAGSEKAKAAQPAEDPSACLTKTPTPAERGFAKVAGMHELKKLLYEEVISALRDPDDLKAYGLTIPNGILLFGPPGCGKTYISVHLAEEMNYFFKEVFPSEIGSTFIHETTLKIREVFDLAYQHAPSIIFVDEFESMVPARKNLGAHQQHTAEEVSEFLKQLEACADRRILLIAATNEPWKIDPAVQRTGRLDKKIYVGAPDKNARVEMLRFHLYGRRQSEIDLDTLAEATAGYSASDLKLLVDEAARMARRARDPITEAYLRRAASERVPPSVSPEDEQKYLAFGQRGVKAAPNSYVAANSALPGRRSADLVRKWGRGRQPGRDSARNTP